MLFPLASSRSHHHLLATAKTAKVQQKTKRPLIQSKAIQRPPDMKKKDLSLGGDCKTSELIGQNTSS